MFSSQIWDLEFICCFRARCFQILNKCGHFEWIETYAQRVEQIQGYNDSLPVDSNGAATRELPSVGVENLGSSDIGADRDMRRVARNGELLAESELSQELRKIKKHLKEMIDLQKQGNIIACGFYCCIIAMFFFYLLSIRS